MENSIPAVLAGRALRSLRDSGYSLAAAIGEVVDNSLEAKANSIHVRLNEDAESHGRPRVGAIAIVDDGAGMDVDTLHRYPQIGFSTRYMSTTTIGKYGVGAKLAALAYSERLDVWSRTHGDSPWMHVYFDLAEADSSSAAGVEATIAAPTEAPVPPAFVDLLPQSSGTLVLWSRVDRLEAGRHASDANTLRVAVEKELARMFRYFIDSGVEIWVNDTRLLAHDPLLLMDGTNADRILRRHYQRAKVDPSFPLKHHYPAKVIADETLAFAGSSVRLRLTVYPPEVVRRRGMGGDQLATALAVPDNEGALSFVRLNREINYTNVPKILPSGVLELDRYIGIEISFTPELDDYMGVRNVKRGVEPHGDLRALIRTQLSRWMPQAREEIKRLWGEASRRQRDAAGEHASITNRLKNADRTLPGGKARPPAPDREKEILNNLAESAGHSGPAAKAAYLARIAELPYVIESVDYPGHSFLEIQHLSHQIIIMINQRHPFYQDVWQPLRTIAEAPAGTVSGDEATAAAQRTVDALTLLVTAYAKAESMDPQPDKFVELRDDWGKFLRSLLGNVRP
ncbi:MAG TPA: ATP-binding protein [Frankiaceae bacterium]|nr:ATP-binding protein [Frankiaceae bacterium]